jgi:hypothetical protein
MEKYDLHQVVALLIPFLVLNPFSSLRYYWFREGVREGEVAGKKGETFLEGRSTNKSKESS